MVINDNLLEMMFCFDYYLNQANENVTFVKYF